MLEPTSRYATIPVATTRIPDGAGGLREVRYLRRRFPPQPSSLRVISEHTVAQGDRLDLVAAAYFDDPCQFWRITDANICLHPDELLAEDRLGARLVIPVPEV
ncbi:MAG TPA: LysM domain-containing protein [Microlunatus sp.]